MTQNFNTDKDKDWAYWLGCAGGILMTLFTTACFIGAIVVYFVYDEKLSGLSFRPPQPTPPPPVDFVTQVDQNAWKLSLSDGFTDNQSRWDAVAYQNDSINLVRMITGGQYIWDFDAGEPYLFWDSPKHKPVSDCIVSAEYKIRQGDANDGFGLILRELGGNRYYFEINSQGRYVFSLENKGEWTSLLSARLPYALRPQEANQIAVQAEGSHFTFFVNGHKINEFEDNTLKSGYAGILLSPSAEFNFLLVTPGTESTPIPMENRHKVVYEVDNFKLWIPAKATLQGHDPLTPEPGRILFTSDVDGNLELYSIRTDAKDLQRLTNDPADDYAGKWSPDGKQVVFVSERDGNAELYLMQADGSNPTRLTENPAADSDPAWSPDGTQIVLSSQRDGNAELYRYTLASRQVERLTDSPDEDRSPAWSPDGKSILFQSGLSGISSIYRLELASGEVEQLTHSDTSIGTAPAWAPGGNKFVYILSYMGLRSELVIADVVTSDTSHIAFGNEKNNWPAWSPGGGQIAFISNMSGQQDIFIVSAGGKELHQLTNDKAVESHLDWTASTETP
jgi:Tol biopolymer transport system component